MGERGVPWVDPAESSRVPLRSIQGGRAADRPGGSAELRLPALTSSGRLARNWVMTELAAGGVFGRANQVVELLTGELVANAALHGPQDGLIRVRTWRVGGAVRVSVRDDSPVEPVVRHPEPTAPSGRGLALVATLSAQWGVELHGPAGKTIWFSVDLDHS